MTIQNTKTLATIRAEALADQAHHFRTSLPLYILIETRPTPGDPDAIEIACLRKDGVEGVLVYLSPIDALLDARTRNSQGRNFFVYPFEASDPRSYIASHDNWLTLYLAYGFAGRGSKLVTSERGDLLTLSMDIYFRIPPGQSDRIHLRFPGEPLRSINAMHRTAGLHDYDGILEEQADASAEELDGEAQEAARHIGPTVKWSGENITECAIYDAVDRRWRFAALPA